MPALHHALVLGPASLCAGLLVTSMSQAHIDLSSPPPRVGGVPDSNLDRAPCGQRTSARVAEKVSIFRPGQTITVAWDVYVQHPGYFRVAFDFDGDDSFSLRGTAPADPARDEPAELVPAEGEIILGYVEDYSAELEHVEQPVTLPSEACDNCTLQLAQFTYELTEAQATYFQCADIVLEGDPIEPVGAGGSMSMGADAATLGAPPDSPGEGGCTLGTAPTRWVGRDGGLSLLALALLARRRMLERR